MKLALDVFNPFNRQGSDTDCFYASRLKGEPAGGIEDIHFHPVEPRSLRLTLTASYPAIGMGLLQVCRCSSACSMRRSGTSQSSATDA